MANFINGHPLGRAVLLGWSGAFFLGREFCALPADADLTRVFYWCSAFFPSFNRFGNSSFMLRDDRKTLWYVWRQFLIKISTMFDRHTYILSDSRLCISVNKFCKCISCIQQNYFCKFVLALEFFHPVFADTSFKIIGIYARDSDSSL